MGTWLPGVLVFRQRLVRLIALALLLLGMMNRSAPAVGASSNPSSCPSWNLAAQFQVAPNEANPNPDACGDLTVWYFYAGSPGAASLVQTFFADNLGTPGLESWVGTFISPLSGLPHDQLPAIGLNATGTRWTYGQIDWPAGAMRVHPAPQQAATVGWQSPITGFVEVLGGVADMDPAGGNGITWQIVCGVTRTAFGSIPNGGAQLFRNGTNGSSLRRVFVTAGDFLYVSVGAKDANYYADSTQLDVTIVRAN